jgi:hypothetical protein
MRIDEVAEWGEAHFREPASPTAVESLEASLGHPVPGELRELLMQTDGIEGEYGLGLVWTTDRIAADNAHFRTSSELANLYMPFAGLLFFADAGNGDQFFVSLSGNHEVYVWDHESDSRTWVAATVLGYLRAWMQGDVAV